MHDTIGRFGYVSAYDPQRHYARVEFPDLGIVSAWLPVGVRSSKNNHDEHHLDIGEHVFCILHDNSGIILASIYDDSNSPPVANENVRAITFKDGTSITYDREQHITHIKDCNGNEITMNDGGISILSGGNITMNASGNIKLTASRIDLN